MNRKLDGTVESLPNWRPGRDLAALAGGPWNACWYWQDELEQQRATDKAKGLKRGKHHYHPTEERVINPDQRLGGVTGRVWQWTP